MYNINNQRKPFRHFHKQTADFGQPIRNKTNVRLLCQYKVTTFTIKNYYITFVTSLWTRLKLSNTALFSVRALLTYLYIEINYKPWQRSTCKEYLLQILQNKSNSHFQSRWYKKMLLLQLFCNPCVPPQSNNGNKSKAPLTVNTAKSPRRQTC